MLIKQQQKYEEFFACKVQNFCIAKYNRMPKTDTLYVYCLLFTLTTIALLQIKICLEHKLCCIIL